MSRASSGSEWSGDMLDRPEMVEAFATQLRRAMSEYADYVARIRRDAEAMWAANPPPEYGSFEAWWRHRRVTSPFEEIQEHLEAAAKLTFRLAAQHRRQRHELPAERRAAIEAKQQKVLGSSGEPAGGVSPRQQGQQSRAAAGSDANFMDILRNQGRSA